MTSLSSRLLAAGALASLALVGWMRVRHRLDRCGKREGFTREFLEKLQRYVASGGADFATYGWLTLRSLRMQEELGELGSLAAFHRPYQQHLVYKNAPVVVTLLPELYRELTKPGLLGPNIQAINAYQQTLQEVFFRHLGSLADQREGLESEKRNPFVWFREGVRLTVLSPLHVLGWLGILSPAALGKASASWPAKYIGALVTLLGLLAAIVTIVVGWGQFTAIVKATFR